MSIKALLGKVPILPVLVVDAPARAVTLARALVSGGLPVLEITLRTPAAIDCLRAIVAEVPEAHVGVGTLTHPGQFELAEEAGARFAISPGLTEDLVRASRNSGMPFMPGVFSPSEVLRARDDGFQVLKLFPAEQAGGFAMLKALAGPIPEVSFCPTGGVRSDNCLDYLRLPNVVCVGGSWVAPAGRIEAGDWDGITALAIKAVELAANARLVR